jgi:hypothetical protein
MRSFQRLLKIQPSGHLFSELSDLEESPFFQSMIDEQFLLSSLSAGISFSVSFKTWVLMSTIPPKLHGQYFYL